MGALALLLLPGLACATGPKALTGAETSAPAGPAAAGVPTPLTLTLRDPVATDQGGFRVTLEIAPGAAGAATAGNAAAMNPLESVLSPASPAATPSAPAGTGDAKAGLQATQAALGAQSPVAQAPDAQRAALDKTFDGAGGHPEHPGLTAGLDPQTHNEMLQRQIAFQAKAKALNPALKIIDLLDLDQLKREKIVVGFAGFSGGKDFNEAESRLVITSVLRQLDPNKTLLASGATAEGVPALVYEIGAKLGFKTIGITSLKAGSYAPARMDYLVVTGHEFGKESPSFIDAIDALIAVGGGNQTYKEMMVAKNLGKPVLPVANDKIVGASKRFPGRKFHKGETAGKKAADIIGNMEFFRWVHRLPDRTTYALPDALRTLFPGKELIGFTGWSRNAPEGRDGRVEAFTRELLGALDSKKHIIVTGGSHLGAEKIVHEVAAELGFTIIAEVSHSISNPKTPMYEGVSVVVPVARTWQGRTYGLINNVDALVSYGGGDPVVTQVTLAKKRGIPFVHMSGNVALADKLIASHKFRSGRRAGADLLAGLKPPAVPAAKSP